jgi:hypothetical protein
MLLNQSSPLGAFSRILLESSHWTSSAEFCYVWQRLDTRFACSAFQLTPLGQSIEGNGSSLWRTPNASDVTGGPMDGERRLAQGHQLNLCEQAATPKLWPSPSAGNARPLSEVASLLPTPQAHDAAKGDPARVGRFGTEHGGRNLNDTIGGSLNPHFVEELMGFPIDHTALKRSETRPSRNRRIRSSKQFTRLKHAREKDKMNGLH